MLSGLSKLPGLRSAANLLAVLKEDRRQEAADYLDGYSAGAADRGEIIEPVRDTAAPLWIEGYQDGLTGIPPLVH